MMLSQIKSSYNILVIYKIVRMWKYVAKKNVAVSRTQTGVNFRGLFTFRIFPGPSLGFPILISKHWQLYFCFEFETFKVLELKSFYYVLPPVVISYRGTYEFFRILIKLPNFTLFIHNFHYCMKTVSSVDKI